MVWDKDLLYTAGEMRGQGGVLLGHMGLTHCRLTRGMHSPRHHQPGREVMNISINNSMLPSVCCTVIYMARVGVR